MSTLSHTLFISRNGVIYLLNALIYKTKFKFEVISGGNLAQSFKI